MNSQKKKILIIGAGIAGLAAGSYLRDHDFDITILEARNQIGGRTRSDNALGFPFGHGAAWIHGIENNPITALADQYNARYLPVDFTQFYTFNAAHQRISEQTLLAFNQMCDEKLALAKSYANQLSHDISLETALSHYLNPAQLSIDEQALFQRKLLFFENYYGADYSRLSARHWDQEEMWPGKHCILTDTYDPIIQGLSKNCDIKLNQIVREITELDNHIEIKTDSAIYHGEAVIVTVSLGVLKKHIIKFKPELPEFKLQAIHKLGMGLFNIIALKFPSIFWPTDCMAMFLPFVKPNTPSVFFNFVPFVQQPILVSYTGGNTGLALEKNSDSEIINIILEQLKLHFKNNIPHPDAYLITRWSQDPCSFGSYSYNAVGASGDDYDNLATPVSKRLYFAGEATSRRFPATTHGAYLSGIREAERIIAFFR